MAFFYCEKICTDLIFVLDSFIYFIYTYYLCIGLSQVVWAACYGFVPCHEADVLGERDVGHLLLQQTEGRSSLQSLLSSHPKDRLESAHKQTKTYTELRSAILA